MTQLISQEQPRVQISSGFKISQKEYNVLAVAEPPLLNKKGAKGKTYNFTYVSTAGIGKSIFWKLSDDFLVAWGAKQCI